MNSANRLNGATVGANTATMTYDGPGRLFSKTAGASTTRFTYDQNLPLSQMLTEGDNIYMYGLGMGSGYGPMMRETAGVKNWLHGDALASVRFTTDAAGAVVGSSTYDAFGAQRVQAGQQNLFRYAGQEDHTDIALQHMRARWYDPAVGRFISAGPFAGSDGSPHTRTGVPTQGRHYIGDPHAKA